MGVNVLQGGGLALADAAGDNLVTVPGGPKVPNEFLSVNSNVAGTIAMAQSGSGAAAADSATNEFYFNTLDNTALDSTKFTVFGKLDAASQSVLSNLGQTPTTDESASAFAGTHSDVLTNVPLTGYAPVGGTFPTNAVASNYMRITSISRRSRICRPSTSS